MSLLGAMMTIKVEVKEATRTNDSGPRHCMSRVCTLSYIASNSGHSTQNPFDIFGFSRAIE